jgi:hypothetical protein
LKEKKMIPHHDLEPAASASKLKNIIRAMPYLVIMGMIWGYLAAAVTGLIIGLLIALVTSVIIGSATEIVSGRLQIDTDPNRHNLPGTIPTKP